MNSDDRGVGHAPGTLGAIFAARHELMHDTAGARVEGRLADIPEKMERNIAAGLDVERVVVSKEEEAREPSR